ncbi:MAG: RluA family pseudouridine synthase [Planctomycetaceae bacterium]|nr:MAG: RluA family pseudouridine synthase [Planctomycetaceae bacterium]
MSGHTSPGEIPPGGPLPGSATRCELPSENRPTAELSADPVTLTVESRAHGWRVDHFLSRLYPNYSRALFQKAVEQNGVLVNGLPVKSSRRLHVNDIVSVRLPERPDRSVAPEEFPLEIVFEDEYLVVINKPAGMITHPGRGRSTGTLAAALQFHFDRLSTIAGEERPGIVHRLDRDTTGVIVVAKDNQVHHRLSEQFEQREVRKEYVALTWGVIDRDSDWIDTFIRVNPREREKMIVCEPTLQGRPASTFYEVIDRFFNFTYVRLFPKTGRTHQLRVHLKNIGHPIVADHLYGGRAALSARELTSRRDRGATNPDPAADDVLICRQALHARRIEFRHPATGLPVAFEAPLPVDFERTLAALRASR